MSRLPILRHLFAWLALVVLALAASAAPVRAQSVTGSIQGTVVDQSGGVLPGVTVTVTNTATGAVRTSVTDTAGLFRVELLPVGPYELSADLSGFASRKQPDITLTVGNVLTFRIEMRVGGVAESVNVVAESPILETTRSQVSDTVGEAAVRNLPVNGRNFINFALLTPGVTTDVRTGDISFAGQRGTLNSLVVDGADDNNTFFGQTIGRTGSGRAPYQFSASAVKEFQVNSNAYSAEYGRAGGAVINVVTKSGTNAMSGEGFYFLRDKALNANNLINVQQGRAKSPYHYDQFGGYLSGPLRKDHDFFFVNYDGQRNTLPNLVFLNTPANTPTDPDTQAAIARLSPLAASWDQAQNQDTLLVKTDHQLNTGNRLTIRYNYQNFNGKNFESSGPQIALEHTGDSNVRTQTLNSGLTSVLGSALFNEVRVQWAKDQEPGEANSPNPEATIQQGGTNVLVIGRNSFSPRETTIKRWQFADALTWARGAHKVKTGFDFQFDNILNYFPGNFFGAYTFGSLAAFNQNQPNRYVQAFAGPNTSGGTTHPDIQEYSFFAQDEWRIGADLTLNAGLRYDVQKFASPEVKNPDPQLAAANIDTSFLPTDTNNWGPRLGLAWSPVGRRYLLRGGYGLFFGRTPAIMVGTAHSNNGINVQTITFTGSQIPTYPAVFTSLPTGAALPKPTIFNFDRSYQNPRVEQASIGFEYQVMADTAIVINYLNVRGHQLPRSTDLNVGTETTASYTVAGSGQVLTYPRFTAGPLTNFGRIISFQSTADSEYNGLTIELNRRFARHVSARVAYTLGKVTDTVPDATAVVPGSSTDDAKYASNPKNFAVDDTVGNNDQRHRFVFSGIYDTNGMMAGKSGIGAALARGWNFSAIYTAAAGQPYSARVGNVDLNNDGNTRNDFAPGTTRNQYNLPNYYALDFRIARDIRLAGLNVQPIFEAFNVLNADNVNSVNQALYGVNTTTNVLTPGTSFGQPLTTAGQRIMQVAIKVMF